MTAHISSRAWHEGNRSGRFIHLREVLSSEYAELADDDLETVFDEAFGEGSAEDLEDFWGSVRNFGRQAGGVLKNALPGMIQGATTGAALGPWGILGGAVAGGALSAAQQGGLMGGGRGVAPRARPRRPGPGIPSGPPIPAGGSPAAAQLLQLISRPELLQSLLSMTLGQAGRRQIPVGNTPVPPGAFTNLLGALAGLAAEEYHALTASEGAATPAYLLDDAGEFICDPANPIERAQALWETLEAVDRATEDDEQAREDEPLDAVSRARCREDYLNRVYDQVELAELYASGELES